MIKKESRNDIRKKRHNRIRNNISGTKEIPRLNVFRSNKEIFAQVIDDVLCTTLASSSSVELKIKNGGNKEGAALVGADIAKKCIKLKIKKVVFDRGGYLYHGRVAALADAARTNGLEF
ncbi:MAG: 50S ribosomal protein L18 [Bacilli bacterium]|nr:50S ribosomal protein L18 [Bacilli bacterium]MDD4407657.1 50S ribosomal protein L18 [Bacilli bacterium]